MFVKRPKCFKHCEDTQTQDWHRICQHSWMFPLHKLFVLSVKCGHWQLHMSSWVRLLCILKCLIVQWIKNDHEGNFLTQKNKKNSLGLQRTRKHSLFVSKIVIELQKNDKLLEEQKQWKKPVTMKFLHSLRFTLDPFCMHSELLSACPELFESLCCLWSVWLQEEVFLSDERSISSLVEKGDQMTWERMTPTDMKGLSLQDTSLHGPAIQLSFPWASNPAASWWEMKLILWLRRAIAASWYW